MKEALATNCTRWGGMVLVKSVFSLQSVLLRTSIASDAMRCSCSSTLYDHVGVDMSSAAYQGRKPSKDSVRSMQISKDKGEISRKDCVN